jgi:hypothetical protein
MPSREASTRMATSTRNDGLGLLYALPLDVRRLIYARRGVAYRVCALSRVMRAEVAPLVERYRHDYSISGREVALYLEEVTRVPCQRFTIGGVVLSDGPDGVESTFRWEVASTAGSRTLIRATDLESARKEREDHAGPRLRSVKDRAAERTAAWHRLLELLRAAGRVLPRHRYGIEILMRRALHERDVGRRREYAWKHYLLLSRRLLERVVKPAGYSLSQLLRCPLVGRSMCYDETRRAVRIPETVPEEGIAPLLRLSQRLGSVYRYSFDYLTVLGPDVQVGEGRLLSYVKFMSFRALRHVTTRGCRRDVGALRLPRGRDVRAVLTGLLERGRCSTSVRFCEFGSTEVEAYDVRLDDRPDGVKVVWVLRSGDDALSDELVPLGESIQWSELLASLEERAGVEMVVSTALGRRIYATDGEYARALRDQMRRSAEGLGVSVEDLLGNPDDGYMAARTRRHRLVEGLDSVGPHTEVVAARVIPIRRLYTLVSVLTERGVRDEGDRKVAGNLLSRMDELGLWTLLNL